MPADSPSQPDDSKPQSGSDPGPVWPADLAVIRRDMARTNAFQGRGVSFSQSLVIWSAVGACCVVVIIAWRLLVLSSFPFTPLLVLGGAATVVMVVLGFRAMIRFGFDSGRAHKEGLFDPINSGARVRVLCRIPEAEALRQHPPNPNASFEPEIARIPLARGFAPFDRRLAILGAIAGFLSALGFALFVSGINPMRSVNIWLMMGGAAAGATIVPEVFFPTWVRVVPGRIDVIRENLLARRIQSVTKIDLRDRAVVLTNAAIILEPPDPKTMGQPPADAVSFFATFDRKRMKATILNAAISKVPPPEVSDEELFG